MTRKTISMVLAAGLLTAGMTTLAPKPARAGADGRRNTTIALGAAAVYELLQHKTTNALILGAGAAYAEKQYENARKSERDKNNNRRYYRPGSGYYDNNGGYYDNNGRYQNGGGDYERRTDGRHDGSSRDGSRCDDDRDTDRNDGSQRVDDYSNLRGRKRGWDGRSLPPGQYKKWNGDRH